MRLLHVAFMALTTLLVASCGGAKQQDQISGEWTLTSFINNGEEVVLTECDKQTRWNFTNEAAEALGDGTEVQKLQATSPENCEYYGFDAKWTVKDGSVFISTSRIGGMGGQSLAGMMQIKELTNNKMVLEILNKTLTFEK